MKLVSDKHGSWAIKKWTIFGWRWFSFVSGNWLSKDICLVHCWTDDKDVTEKWRVGQFSQH